MMRTFLISGNNKPTGGMFQGWIVQHLSIRAVSQLLEDSLGLSLMVSE